MTFSKRTTMGACSANSCSKMFLAFQILSIATAAAYGMATIGKIIISLRSVLPQNKGLALAMEIMCLGLFAYSPVHLAYDIVSRSTCMYWAPHRTRCLLRENPKHGNILNILTATLIFLGLIFDVLVYIYIKGLNIYNCKVTDMDYTPSLYSPLPQDEPTHTAVGGSPATLVARISRDTQQTAEPTRPAPLIMPRPEITVFHQPSTLINSSGGGSSVVEPASTGVTYAQVVFPPNKRKLNDGSTSPKRLAVRADVPLHYLSVEDVRIELLKLKSFNPDNNENTENAMPTTQDGEGESNLGQKTGAIPKKPIETALNAIRPQSPETDF